LFENHFIGDCQPSQQAGRRQAGEFAKLQNMKKELLKKIFA
jgi:hypothetical protein